ncbi:hypothetical protein APSETT444_007984 [Aspergillus pseudonomiae]
MAVNSYQCTTNPLLIPEIVGLVMENVDRVPDLLNCARVNRMWMVPALKNLYRGSLNDMQFQDDPAIGGICRLLMIRDLEFVYIEEWHELGAFERFELSGRLLPHLRAQKNLKALVLSIRGCGNPLAEEEEGPLWPRLKALYIDRPDREWFVQLPKFKDLQIFKLLDLTSDAYINAAVAKCKHLRVLELPNLRLDAPDENQVMETFLDIARGCPLLQKLSVKVLSGTWHGEVTKPLLSNLLRALPRLEVLGLGFQFRVYGTELEDLAHHCPRLTFLELPAAELFISLSQMSRTLPLRYLQIMRFYQVWFKYPLPFIRGVNFHNLVTEWSRIFPKLRTEPCSNDVEYSPGILSGEEEYSIDHREELSFPDDEEDREDSEWHVIRAKLWQALGYGKVDDGVDNGLHYMWQTNLEIETIGWPVLSSKAFIHPVWHSSTPTKY